MKFCNAWPCQRCNRHGVMTYTETFDLLLTLPRRASLKHAMQTTKILSLDVITETSISKMTRRSLWASDNYITLKSKDRTLRAEAKVIS